jgi:phosphoglycolate phosphatase
VKALLFDLDGTLADTIDDIGGAMNAALAAAGLSQHPLDDYRRFIGDGIEALTERALPAGRADLRVATIAAFRNIYAGRLVERTRPYDGIAAVLDALAARRIPAAVLSNKPEPATVAIVDRLFGPGRFVAVAGALPGRPRKPDPWRALEIARAAGVAPADWLFVGDTAVDMQTATAAGMTPVGAAWGYRDRAELAAAGATAILARAADLLPLLRG